MGNKNNPKTMNERTHNPFDKNQQKDRDARNSNSNNPLDSAETEFASEFDATVKNKNNKTTHNKNQQSNKRK